MDTQLIEEPIDMNWSFGVCCRLMIMMMCRLGFIAHVCIVELVTKGLGNSMLLSLDVMGVNVNILVIIILS